jgi:hypothetical protein
VAGAESKVQPERVVERALGFDARCELGQRGKSKGNEFLFEKGGDALGARDQNSTFHCQDLSPQISWEKKPNKVPPRTNEATKPWNREGAKDAKKKTRDFQFMIHDFLRALSDLAVNGFDKDSLTPLPVQYTRLSPVCP